MKKWINNCDYSLNRELSKPLSFKRSYIIIDSRKTQQFYGYPNIEMVLETLFSYHRIRRGCDPQEKSQGIKSPENDSYVLSRW